METAQIIVAFVFGLAFVIALIVLAVEFPAPTPFQYTVFRIVLALAAAGVAAMIPGFINIEVNATAQLMIRAGGAIAVFVMVFFFNPAQLAFQDKRFMSAAMGDNFNPVPKPVWDVLDPTLQDAFVLAANAARREGKEIVSTRVLFAALLRLQPDRLVEFVGYLPTESLPEPIPLEIPQNPSALGEIHQLSSCVQDSLANLAPLATRSERLTDVDVFVDIARHGHGESVRRLRTHGVSPERIDEVVSQLGWSIKRRDV